MNAVVEGLKNMRKCSTPETHAEFQPPRQMGRLTKAESLDPKDVIHFKVCGLCGGMLTDF